MSAFSKFIGGIAGPISGILGINPNPVSQLGSTIAGEIAKKEQKKNLAEYKENFMATLPPNAFGLDSYGQTSTTGVNRAGFGSNFGNFLGDATSNILAPLGTFASGIRSLFGMGGGGRPTSSIGQPAITTVTNVGAQESSGSGTVEAFAGALPNILGSGVRNLFKSPFGQVGLGGTAGLVGSLIGSDGKTMRVTRKMKSQARTLLNITGGNLQITADFLNISEEQLVFILLKRFRNDGPVVTKAALRKTKSTIRKMKNMCDMYDDLRPAARRRPAMKRATRSTTLIKN